MATKKLQIVGSLGSNVEIDATLQETGKAADAKAVSDAIESLKDTYIGDDTVSNQINTAINELSTDVAYIDPTDNETIESEIASVKAVLYTPQVLTESQKAQARNNIGLNNIFLGIASDGLIYIFINGEPVGTGIPQGQSGDVFGYVDENNNIVLTGNLADGTYSIKYEMEDGSKIDIGVLAFVVSVTNDLTNCTNNNSAIEIGKGESYSATISADSSYALSSVTVTMGGTDITSTAVSGGVINIASVTGNIVITAVAVETVEPTNFFVIGGDGYLNPGRASSTGADRTDVSTCLLTNYIQVQNGDIVYVEGMVLTGNLASNSGFYNTSKTGIYGAKLESATSYVTDTSFSDNGGQFTINNANVGYIRICGAIPSDLNAVKITIQRNGEWL